MSTFCHLFSKLKHLVVKSCSGDKRGENTTAFLGGHEAAAAAAAAAAGNGASALASQELPSTGRQCTQAVHNARTEQLDIRAKMAAVSTTQVQTH